MTATDEACLDAMPKLPRRIGDGDQPLLRLRLIGPMSVPGPNGEDLLPRVRKTRAVLAVLAIAAPRPVSRDQITALLWSTREREQARASLRQAAHELQGLSRHLGAELIHAERHHLQLDSRPLWIDAQALASASSMRPEPLELLTGPFLGELVGLDPAFDAWIRSEALRLETMAASVAATILAEQVEPDHILKAARRLVAISPGHEGGWRAIMRVHAERGEKAAVLAAYEACAGHLANQGRLSPAPETDALLAELRQPAPRKPASTARPAAQVERAGTWMAVAPFRSAADGGEDWLAMGLAEEITTALGRFRWINLIAPGSIEALSTEPRGETERWRRLGLDFLLDGVIQRGGDRMRVTVRLLDMRAAGEVVWSGRFDHPATDLLALQDDIASETVARIDPALLLHESRRVSARAPEDATAYELLLRAIPAIYRLDEGGYRQAGAWLRQAAARAPENGSIHAWWACWHAFLVGQGWADEPGAAMLEASRLADRAVALDPGCARALAVAGYVRSFILHRSIDETISLHERALALNPNLPFAWVVSALTLSYAGEHEAAIARARQALRLSPFDPHSFFFDSALMVPLLMLRRFEEVVVLGRKSVALNPGLSATYKGLLSALGHLGRQAEAREVLEQLLRREPGFNLRQAAERSPLRRVEDLHLYLEGLRMAGLAEG